MWMLRKSDRLQSLSLCYSLSDEKKKKTTRVLTEETPAVNCLGDHKDRSPFRGGCPGSGSSLVGIARISRKEPGGWEVTDPHPQRGAWGVGLGRGLGFVIRRKGGEKGSRWWSRSMSNRK